MYVVITVVGNSEDRVPVYIDNTAAPDFIQVERCRMPIASHNE